MSSPKHDWAEYKKRFMLSKHIDVTAFCREELGLGMSSHTISKTKGWRAEKLQRKHRVVSRLLDKVDNREVQEMAKALSNMRGYMKMKVKDEETLKKLSPRDAFKIWEMLRTENNLPTKITKNTNINFSEEQEDEALSSLQDNNSQNDGSDIPKTEPEIQDTPQEEGGGIVE